MAVLCLAVSREEHEQCTAFQVAARLGVPVPGFTRQLTVETITGVMKTRLGFTGDMAAIYNLIEPMGYPSTRRESMPVVISMLPNEIRRSIRTNDKQGSLYDRVVHTLVQMHVDGHMNYLVVDIATSCVSNSTAVCCCLDPGEGRGMTTQKTIVLMCQGLVREHPKFKLLQQT